MISLGGRMLNVAAYLKVTTGSWKYLMLWIWLINFGLPLAFPDSYPQGLLWSARCLAEVGENGPLAKTPSNAQNRSKLIRISVAVGVARRVPDFKMLETWSKSEMIAWLLFTTLIIPRYPKIHLSGWFWLHSCCTTWLISSTSTIFTREGKRGP